MHKLNEGFMHAEDEIEHLRRRVAALEAQLADREQSQAPKYAPQEIGEMIDRIGDVFFAVDREWRYLYVNPKAAAVAGAETPNLLGKSLWESFPQLIGTIYEKEYRRAMDQQIPVHIEDRGVVSGRWYETFVYPSPHGLSIYGRDITARKQAEEALLQHRLQTEYQLAELKTIYATAPAGLCYLDRDLRYISVSDKLAAWANITPADLIGRTVNDVSPNAENQFGDMLRHILESGEALINLEYRAPLPSAPDELHDWLLNYYPVRNDDGNVIGVNAVVQDITEWKQLQREREEALLLLDAFFSLAPVGLAFVDPDLRFVRVNEALASINGLPPAAHLNKRPDELPLNLLDMDEILRIWQQILIKGEAVRGIEISGETPAAPGVTRYWLENWYPVRAGERIIGMGIMVEEITERKRYEQALQQSQARFQQLADAMPQLVWTANPDGTVDYYNQRRQEFHGFTKTSSGWDWAPTLHPNDIQRTTDAWQHAVKTGTVYEVEHRVRLLNGEFEWFLSRGIPVRNEAGQIVKWYGTATNIHASKVAAAEREELLSALQEERCQLQQLTATLEDRVAQGIDQIRSLAARLTLAEHQERQRVAQILHDHVQQMLYAVQMRAHLIELDLPAQQANPLRTHVDEMKRLTNEAIRITRTLSVELSPPVLESEGLAEAIAWLSSQMKEIHDLQITINVKGNCQIEAKNLRVMLFQASRELLFNVVKHAQVNAATVDLWCDGEKITIVISDSGQGIDLDALAQNKVGFGLASIRERLNLFDGQLLIESAPGQGTRTTIICPL